MALATSSPDAFVDLIFTMVGQKADQLLATDYPLLAAKVQPVALAIAMIWVAVKVVRVHSGRDPSNIWPLMKMVMTIVFVFWGLSWSAGGVAIYHFFTELRDDTSAIFLNGQSLVQYVDFANDKFSAIATHLMAASWENMGIIALGLLLQFVDCVLVVIVLFLKAGSEMGLAITTVLGPLFLPTLFWSSTRGYGMNWFSAQLKFALVGVLLAVCVSFSFGITENLMTNASGVMAIAPDDVKAADVGAAFILEIFMCLFVAFGVRPLASALASSGAAGGGLAEMAAGMLVSNVLTKAFSGGKGGGRSGGSGGPAPAANAGATAGGNPGGMQQEPSGAGQPGTEASAPAASPSANEGARW